MKHKNVVPLSDTINETLRELDEREWDGDFSKSKQLNVFLFTLKEMEAKGEVWYPLF